MMDKYILFSAFLRFILFLAIHFLVFRRIKREEMVKWIIYVYISTAFISIFIKLSFFPGSLGTDIIFAEIISLVIYTFLVMFYILGVFGLMVSSLRIRLLSMIVEAEKNGIKQSEILKEYNKKIIVGRRLDRLISTKEVSLVDGYYSLNSKFSVFLVHAKLLDILRRIFS